MADPVPAFRTANRLAIAFRLPERVTITSEKPPRTYDWRTDPKAYHARVVAGIPMAGHNVTR